MEEVALQLWFAKYTTYIRGGWDSYPGGTRENTYIHRQGRKKTPTGGVNKERQNATASCEVSIPKFGILLGYLCKS